MDYLEQTRSRPVPTEPRALAHAVEELRDRAAIGALISLYSVARDDNDLDGVVSFFAPDGIFEVGGRQIRGHDELRSFYQGNMEKYRTSYHVNHTSVLSVRDQVAEGIVTGHAELAYRGTLMLAGIRYADDYRKLDDRWVFAHRRLRFMYAVPADQLAGSFVDRLRIRWPGEEPALADIPEGLPTYPGPAGASREGGR